jgi:phage/plasmid-like protein (TIGR03299 family)
MSQLSTASYIATAGTSHMGIGKSIDAEMTPKEALQHAGLDWRVDQWPISATDGKTRLLIGENVANVRSDTNQCLAVVGKDYRPIQNQELAEFADAIASYRSVKCESAGMIKGGAKVWFLLSGASFDVGGNTGGDEVKPYILAINGHDGGQTLKIVPTTRRIVCNNMLPMIMKTDGRRAIYCARHSGDMKRKLSQAAEAISVYYGAVKDTRAAIETLVAKPISGAIQRQLFLDSYTRDFGAIPGNPQDDAQAKVKARAVAAFTAYDSRFQKESAQFGASVWIAVNAYTGWLQNDRDIRVKDAMARREHRAALSLYGEDADRSLKTFAAALSA